MYRTPVVRMRVVTVLGAEQFLCMDGQVQISWPQGSKERAKPSVRCSDRLSLSFNITVVYKMSLSDTQASRQAEAEVEGDTGKPYDLSERARRSQYQHFIPRFILRRFHVGPVKYVFKVKSNLAYGQI